MLPALQIGLLLLSLVLCGWEPTHAKPDHDKTSHTEEEEKSQAVVFAGDRAFRLVNTSMTFFRAEGFCRGLFGSLLTLGDPRDELGALELRVQAGLRPPVWVRALGTAAAPVALSRQYSRFLALSFPREPCEGFARVNRTFPPLPAVTVCVRVQWERQWRDVSTVFSYAAPTLTNEFQLRGQVSVGEGAGPGGRVRLALIAHGRHHPYNSSFANDGGWHHLCVVWARAGGRWAVFVDGERRDGGREDGGDAPRDIHGNGIFILGQDQDSFGGNFTEPFVGNLTDLNVWGEPLGGAEIHTLSSCAVLPPRRGSLFAWGRGHVSMHPVVTETEALIFCPAKSRAAQQGCRTLGGWSEQQLPLYSSTDCSSTLPFICSSSTERYRKVQQLGREQSSQPSPWMTHMMKISNRTQVGFESFSGPLAWEDASNLLNASVRSLEGPAGTELQATDMLTLIQLLSVTALAAESPPPGDDSRSARDLSQHFLSVADSVISQDSAPKWQAIGEVVGGPMEVVRSIDRLVANLRPRLLQSEDHLLIHSSNIKLELQQMPLEAGPGVSEFCGPERQNQAALDCISVPRQKIQDLHDDGFRKLTLVSAWYGSLRPPFSTAENFTAVPTVTDGGQRYLGTILGSSVISTTVLGDDQPVSMAVRFRLQHTAQKPDGVVYNPLCAYWDFDLSAEAGGRWSTRGCELEARLQGSTFCYCNHTTNFALLMQVYEVQRSPEHERALRVLTFLGCGVSLCGLLFTLVLFIALGVPKSDRCTVHKNLMVALGTAELLLMCSDWASAHQGLCVVVTAMLHLFFMASFCWMLVEGLLLWSKVVSVNVSEHRRMKLYYAIGWGLPVLIVGATLVVSLDRYKADSHCWLSVETDMIWAFVGPVLFVLAVNAVVLCRVVMVTVSSARRRAKMLTPSSASKMHTFDLTWAVTRPVLILMPVLGLTWLCGVLVHLSVVVAYLFIALNAFQGLYIFLVYAVYNSEVRNAIKRIKEKRKALSFTNCSQPIGFLPTQRAPPVSWGHRGHVASSPETSETSGPPSSASTSLVIKNETFRKESFVNFSLKAGSGNQVVQLTAFKPSGD